MHYRQIQDRIARGLGTAARHVGPPYDAFRPRTAHNPLAPEHRYLRLPAAFADENLSLRHPVGYGHAGWGGIFDTAYTRPGDYLVGEIGTFFISAQQPLLPAFCILTNRIVTITRAASPGAAGVNAYGGLTTATATTILSAWPASILFAGTGSPGDLPGDATTPNWTILLPTIPVGLRPADLISDDQGSAYVIGSVERTFLGWRLLAKQAST
ncbi:hypothetical protein [Acidisphaera sp. L21]|uniref:hypothetical protein n=1 Tax=Acidisphaera sp. L21 TaxID=1641851 RepID=UPI00131AEF68|nr:hypothetical protein [Acidisphaera sp. L21]